DADAADAGVQAVGEREIDDAEFPAEGDGGLGAPFREWPEARAAAAREHHGERLPGEVGHGLAVGARACNGAPFGQHAAKFAGGSSHCWSPGCARSAPLPSALREV